MTPEQLHILQHCLGADQYGRRERYGDRNYFFAGVKDEQVCKELVALGYMVQHETTRWLPYFNCSATGKGINAMLKESPAPPKISRSKQRYLDFLRYGGAMTFREWIMSEKERKEWA